MPHSTRDICLGGLNTRDLACLECLPSQCSRNILIWYFVINRGKVLSEALQSLCLPS